MPRMSRPAQVLHKRQSKRDPSSLAHTSYMEAPLRHDDRSSRPDRSPRATHHQGLPRSGRRARTVPPTHTAFLRKRRMRHLRTPPEPRHPPVSRTERARFRFVGRQDIPRDLSTLAAMRPTIRRALYFAKGESCRRMLDCFQVRSTVGTVDTNLACPRCVALAEAVMPKPAAAHDGCGHPQILV